MLSYICAIWFLGGAALQPLHQEKPAVVAQATTAKKAAPRRIFGEDKDIGDLIF